MKRLIIGLSVTLLSSCSTDGTTLPILTRVTKIQVVGQHSGSYPFKAKVKWITDKNKIAQILAVVNKQRTGWSSPNLTPMPFTDTAVVFYKGKIEQRVLGVGSDFFSTFGKKGGLLRNVSVQEKQELLSLIRSPKQPRFAF
ncbi:MAG TPA: hypothetical protein VF627_06950 [Abditibacterium sp.]|jgi:hypothetical protein